MILLRQRLYSQIFALRTRQAIRSFTSFDDSESEKFDPKVLQHIKRSIKASGNSFKDGFTSIITMCPACDKEKRTTVYINKTTGTLMCPTCQHEESWINTKNLFDTSLTSKERETYLQKFVAGKKSITKEYRNENITELTMPSEDLFKEFISPKLLINKSQLDALQIKYNSIEKTLHIPLLNSEQSVVGEKIIYLSESGKEVTIPSNSTAGLLKYTYSQKEQTKAIVVHSAFDFLALVSQKIDGYSIICLPYGSRSLPQECLPSFEQFKELILWFDFDTAGWDQARNFAHKLDQKRCRFIRPTIEQSTPYIALKNNLNFKVILQKAQPILHKSITTFSSLKEDVLSELQNLEKVNGVKWKRYPILNKLLKGHRKGELTVLTGPTGSGKTTFMSEYSLDLAMQGVSTLWGSFEIRNTRLASTLLRQFVGYPLDDKLDEFDHWSTQLEKLPIYFMTFHGQQSIKVVMEAIDHAQYVHDIQHVIIDNVQFMLGISTTSKHNDKFWEQDAIIAAFRSFATKRNVHVTLVMHPRKERDNEDLTTSSIFGSAKATQEADNVLIIQDKRLTSLKGKKFLQVAKNRYSGDLGIMPLEFNKDGLSYARKKKKVDET